MRRLAIITIVLFLLASSVAVAQTRVKNARAEKTATVKALFKNAGIAYPPHRLFIRAFKNEGDLEIWAQAAADKPFVLIKTYPICERSGFSGPKRREGDGQVPEGFYRINHFNPHSSFHLSMKIDYPNESDCILSDREHPGSAIFIHGDCVTIGCLPMTDDAIKEIYIMTLDSHHPKRAVHVHIFPFRMTDENYKSLPPYLDLTGKHREFWRNIRQGYLYFEKNRLLPKISVEKDGSYRIEPDPSLIPRK